MDYKKKYLKYKNKYLNSKNNQSGGINWNVINYANNIPGPNGQPPLPPTPPPNELDEVCAICLKKIGEESHHGGYIKFDCKHLFHYYCAGHWCAEKWNNGNSCSCPVCRKEQGNTVTLVMF
jgi:hypothetical protein